MKKNKLYDYLGKSMVNRLKETKSFIAGGAITSLFCNREINDIDIYFRNSDSFVDFIYDIWNGGRWITSHIKKSNFIYS